MMTIKIAGLLAIAATIAAAQVPSLSAEQTERVERGEAVQVLSAAEGSPWPRSTVYQFIEATPEECAAVLSDYELQEKYAPRMKSSRIVRDTGKVTDVEYVISIPVYPDERSVSRHWIGVNGAEYRIEWRTVEEPGSKGSVTRGSATFRPMTNTRTGKTGTLMIHDQSVVPASMFARVPMVRNKAIEASRDGAASIRKQVEKERTADRRLLEAQLKRFRARLP